MTERTESSRFIHPTINVERPYFAEHLLTPELPRFSTVISVSFIDYATTENGLIVPSTKILTAVRDPKTNLTDPDVISLPTKRVDAGFGQNLLKHHSVDELEEVDSRASGKRVEVGWRQEKTYDQKPMQKQIKTLLEDKLSMAKALSDGIITTHSVALETSILGKVYGTNADPENGEEMLHMLGLRANIRFKEGTNPFPQKTDSYYGIQFMRADEFTQLVESKDPLLIVRYGDFSKVCVRGLCVRAGNKIVKNAQRNT